MSLTALGDSGALPWQWSAVLGATLAAAALDLRSRRIPNWLTGPCLLAGLVHAAWLGGWIGVAESIAAAVFVALPTIVAYALGQGGAGDAKLMGAVGAWVGLVQGLLVIGAVALCGVALACIVLIRRRGAGDRAGSRDRPQPVGIPYGVAIFSGACVSALGVWAWHA